MQFNWNIKAKRNRPVLTIPRSKFEILLEIISFVVLLGAMGFAAVNWSQLPEIMAMHFNCNGQANRYGNRNELILLGGIYTFIYALLTLISFYPHTFNYIVKITDENAEKQYLAARTFITWIKTYSICMGSYITWQLIELGLNHSSQLNSNNIFVLISGLFISIGYYLIWSFKHK